MEWPGGNDEREAGSGDSSVAAAEAERKAAQQQAKVTVTIGVVWRSIWLTRGSDELVCVSMSMWVGCLLLLQQAMARGGSQSLE